VTQQPVSDAQAGGAAPAGDMALAGELGVPCAALESEAAEPRLRMPLALLVLALGFPVVVSCTGGFAAVPLSTALGPAPVSSAGSLGELEQLSAAMRISSVDKRVGLRMVGSLVRGYARPDPARHRVAPPNGPRAALPSRAEQKSQPGAQPRVTRDRGRRI
jgi:hypothetical protein